jgi:hypothetical protein
MRRRRLSLADMELVASDARIIAVALSYGYDPPDAIAKTFRKQFGCTPSEARKPGVRLHSYSFQATRQAPTIAARCGFPCSSLRAHSSSEGASVRSRSRMAGPICFRSLPWASCLSATSHLGPTLTLPKRGCSGDAGGAPRRERLRGRPGPTARFLVRRAGASSRRPAAFVAHTGEKMERRDDALPMPHGSGLRADGKPSVVACPLIRTSTRNLRTPFCVYGNGKYMRCQYVPDGAGGSFPTEP